MSKVNTQPEELPDETKQGPGLARSLGHGQMTMIVLGSALGTGLFLGSSAAIELAGPAVIVSFVIASIIAACIALTMGEMASRHPVRGGFGTLAAHYLSPFWGYISRWLYWIVTVGVTGTELVACASYLNYWLPGIPLWAGILLFAAIIVSINLASVGSFGVIEYGLSSIKVIAITVFILIGLYLVFVGLPDAPAPGLIELTSNGGFAPNGWINVWLALSIVMFSFGGIELLSITAAEAKDPVKSVRTAAQTSIIRFAFFYILSIGIIVALIPWPEAAASGGDVRASPFVLVFEKIGIAGAAHITNIVVLVAALSAANANLYAGGRMLHSLSSDEMAPHWLGRLSRRSVPVRGVLLSCVGIVFAAVLAFIGVEELFGYMMSLVVFSALMVWGLILVTYIAYRKSGVQGASFRVPGGSGSAVLGLVGVCAVFATVTLVPSMQMAALIGVPFVIAVAIFYRIKVRDRITGDATAAAIAEGELMR